MIASIHQPNFLPWVGFFNKILRSDVYVVFDDVQFPRGKDIAYRNKIKINNGTKWLSVPISNESQLVPWNKAQISNTNWKTDHINSIHEAYRQSTHFETVFDELTKIYDNEYESRQISTKKSKARQRTTHKLPSIIKTSRFLTGRQLNV